MAAGYGRRAWNGPRTTPLGWWIAPTRLPYHARMTSLPASARLASNPVERRNFSERCEAFISRLSTRNWFWQKVCSLIWLPFAFRSGITMRRAGTNRFTAVLPFTRGNRNWYNAMAGAALLGNSEVAAGLFLFGRVGSDYIVVCKRMEYKFLRPCVGPAVYDIVPTQDLDERIRQGGEFNIDLEMDIRQQMKDHGKSKRVGRCMITFHCTPKSMMKARAMRKAKPTPRAGTGDAADTAATSDQA
jgi:hypothetical protein